MSLFIVPEGRRPSVPECLLICLALIVLAGAIIIHAFPDEIAGQLILL